MDLSSFSSAVKDGDLLRHYAANCQSLISIFSYTTLQLLIILESGSSERLSEHISHPFLVGALMCNRLTSQYYEEANVEKGRQEQVLLESQLHHSVKPTSYILP